MAVPNIFGTATSAIPLSQLDTNFATPVTIGNTAVQLGNTVTSFGNVTLTNVTISSGNVIVTGANVSGTANVSTLVVTGNQTSLGNVAITGNISANIATFGAGSNTAPSITTTGDTNTGIFFPAADTIAFSEGGTEVVRIASTGNVGIGTASPARLLSLSAASPILRMTETGANSDLDFIVSTNSGGLNISVDANNEGANSFCAVSVDGSERMRIDSSGNVGIGTSSPSSYGKLAVVGGRIAISGSANSNQAEIAITNTDTSGGDWRIGDNIASSAGTLSFYGGSSPGPKVNIDSSGNLLVGTTGAVRTGDRFSVKGTGAQVASFEQGTNTSGFNVISSNLGSAGNNTSSAHFWGNTNTVGNWYLYGNGTTSYSSDERLKKNIVTTRNGYLEDLCQLRVVKYNWKNDADGTPQELGLIAQEVAQVFPNLVQDDLNKVSEDDETTYKQLKQSVLPFMLLKAIQEQQAIITALTDRITALEQA